METGSKKRQPLSDRTNTSASANYSSVSSSSSSFVKPTKPEPSVPVSSVFKKLLNDIKNDTSVKRNDINNRTSASSNPSDPESSPPPPPHTPAPSQPLKSTSASGNGKHEDSEPYTVYTRRKSARTIRRRQMEIAKPMSFSPAAKTEYKRDKMNKVGNTCASKSYTVPHRKKPRGILSKQDNSNCSLPKDFIEQQREYFAEIDAFELLEEEVKSDDDLT